MNDVSIRRKTLGTLLVFVSLGLFWYGFSLANTAGSMALEYYRTAKVTNEALACEPHYKAVIGSAIIQSIKTARQRKGGSLDSETKAAEKLTTQSYTFSLRLPLTLSILAFLVLIAGSGMAVSGDPFWVLLDPNTKCTSLSRTQAILWTALILGGYAALSSFNIAYGTTDAIAAKTPYQLFPGIDGDLLLLLGIVAGSPIAATYLSGTTNITQCPASESTGLIDRVAELFTTDGSDTTGQLQLSRMQCIFMTLILGCCYASMLFQYADSIDAAALVNAAGQRPVFPDMPTVTGSFWVLLTASHTIFQVSKSNWGKQFFKTGT
ncbi:hypothetical protein [Desulfovibrio sp. TomC]|uniref:hypothetical protein n=1 Tax=Desulfovibrio sp. TomC TaxID=1562888 RepID=UPI0005BD733A|nr:hypothetical protein [Desulfovibrio sp. TomC]